MPSVLDNVHNVNRVVLTVPPLDVKLAQLLTYCTLALVLPPARQVCTLTTDNVLSARRIVLNV
jgi:hypothetical protein